MGHPAGTLGSADILAVPRNICSTTSRAFGAAKALPNQAISLSMYRSRTFLNSCSLLPNAAERLSRLIRMALVRLESEAPSKTLAKNMHGALPGSRRDRRREAGQALQ